jgi:hypothetical protein
MLIAAILIQDKVIIGRYLIVSKICQNLNIGKDSNIPEEAYSGLQAWER